MRRAQWMALVFGVVAIAATAYVLLRPRYEYVWQGLEALPEVINTLEREEYEPNITPDGEFLIFTRGKAGRNADLFMVALEGDGRSDPRPLEDINTDYDEVDGMLGTDGKLYFYSDRPGSLGGYDLYAAPRLDDGRFGEPVNLGPNVNSSFNDYDPCLTRDGRLLYFSSNRHSAGSEEDYDLYVCLFKNGEWSTPKTLDVLNTKANEWEPMLDRSARTLYFTSNRSRDDGDGVARTDYDLYAASLGEQGWGSPRNLGVRINSQDDEFDPCVNPQSDHLLYVRGVRSGSGYNVDIWEGGQESIPIGPILQPGKVSSRLLKLLALLTVGLILVMLLIYWWHRLTTLHKCMVGSVAVHCLVAWLFTLVTMTAEFDELGQKEATFVIYTDLPEDLAQDEFVAAMFEEELTVEVSEAPQREVEVPELIAETEQPHEVAENTIAAPAVAELPSWQRETPDLVQLDTAAEPPAPETVEDLPEPEPDAPSEQAQPDATVDAVAARESQPDSLPDPRDFVPDRQASLLAPDVPAPSVTALKDPESTPAEPEQVTDVADVAASAPSRSPAQPESEIAASAPATEPEPVQVAAVSPSPAASRATEPVVPDVEPTTLSTLPVPQTDVQASEITEAAPAEARPDARSDAPARADVDIPAPSPLAPASAVAAQESPMPTTAEAIPPRPETEASRELATLSMTPEPSGEPESVEQAESRPSTPGRSPTEAAEVAEAAAETEPVQAAVTGSPSPAPVSSVDSPAAPGPQPATLSALGTPQTDVHPSELSESTSTAAQPAERSDRPVRAPPAAAVPAALPPAVAVQGAPAPPSVAQTSVSRPAVAAETSRELAEIDMASDSPGQATSVATSEAHPSIPGRSPTGVATVAVVSASTELGAAPVTASGATVPRAASPAVSVPTSEPVGALAALTVPADSTGREAAPVSSPRQASMPSSRTGHRAADVSVDAPLGGLGAPRVVAREAGGQVSPRASRAAVSGPAMQAVGELVQLTLKTVPPTTATVSIPGGSLSRAMASVTRSTVARDIVPASPIRPATGPALPARPSGLAPSTDVTSSRAPRFASRERVASIEWGEASNLGPTVNTPGADHEPNLSPDGETLLLTRGMAGTNADIFASDMAEHGWSPAEAFDAINSDADEIDAHMDASGTRIVFYSSRDDGIGGYDLYMSVKDGGAWGLPSNLGEAVNSEFNDQDPCLSHDGQTLLFASNRGGEGREDAYDLFTCRATGDGGWGQPVRLPFNTELNERGPALSADGRSLYFASDREGGKGGYDIWVSHWLQGEWQAAMNVGGDVNTSADELDPALTADGRTILFATDRAGGEGSFDIWEASRTLTLPE